MNTTPDITILLKWQGPYHWFSDQGPTILSGAHAELPGVYVWCIPRPDGHLVHYVGQTEKGFGYRHYEHFRYYMAGLYTVHPAELFAAGKLHRIHEARAYAHDPWRRAQPFLDRFPELSREIVGMLRAMRIFVAPLQQSKRIHRRVEAAIVDQLYHADEAHRFQEPGMNMHLRRDDEPPIRVACEPGGLLLGLPDQFDA